MVKMRVFAYRPVVQVSFCFFFAFCLVLSGTICNAGDPEEIISVQGTGYPPIRAESAAQARLMAKRAAIVDAYRNALATSASPGKGDEVNYQELSGFVSGITITNEEYLQDGGVRITAKVSAKNVAVSTARGPAVRTEPRSSEGSGGPQRVTVDEWYNIIRKLVRIEQ